jgi:phosphatidate cytidylyltransferase
VFMFIWIPFVLVIRGFTVEIGRSMSVLPVQLMFTVFSISHLAYLLSLPELTGFNAGGRGLLLFVVFLTEMNDVFQFTWGKILGRHKIIEKISPNKTWEGFIGGFITTIVVAYFIRFLTPFTAMEALFAGAIIAGGGFIGDIIVSAIKRDIGLKDTGNLIPGHGGILDRIDSLAIAAPSFFYFVYNLSSGVLNNRFTCSEIGIGTPSSSTLTNVMFVANITTSSPLNTLNALASILNFAEVFPILIISA